MECGSDVCDSVQTEIPVLFQDSEVQTSVIDSVLPVNNDVVMETINADLENEIDPSVLDDMELYLECDDDELNFIPTNHRQNYTSTNIKFRITFSAGTDQNADYKQRFKCSVCQKLFSMETKFKAHMQSCHGDTKPFKCTVCSYRSSYVKSLKQHWHRKHGEHQMADDNLLSSAGTAVTTKIQSGDCSQRRLEFICAKCSYVTDSETKLQKHFDRTHRIYSCKQCKYSCKQKMTFLLHKKVHENITEEFLCEDCGKLFLTATQLNRHRKVHRDSRVYKCMFNGCSKAFKIQSSLTDHMKTVHKVCNKTRNVSINRDKDNSSSDMVPNIEQLLSSDDTARSRFMCTWLDCGKFFRDQYNLNNHFSKHTKNKKNKCPHCSFTYIQKTSLDWHIKKKHSKNE